MKMKRGSATVIISVAGKIIGSEGVSHARFQISGRKEKWNFQDFADQDRPGIGVSTTLES
jgi:hypothetical protein